MPDWIKSLLLSDEQKAILKTAEEYLGLRETDGKNRSIEIDALITNNGGELGQPYCIWGIQDINRRVASAIDKESFLPHTGSSQELWRLVTRDALAWTGEIPAPGYIAVFRSIADPTKGHGAIVTSGHRDDLTFETIEFNTNGEGSRDGDGVYRRRRSLVTNGNLFLLGFINWPNMFRSKH